VALPRNQQRQALDSQTFFCDGAKSKERTSSENEAIIANAKLIKIFALLILPAALTSPTCGITRIAFQFDDERQRIQSPYERRLAEAHS
jgi:hypothetical protein